ncbi:polysaccharide deacetylase family protein [Microbacterium ulmi]|uniref:Polysaccharide deacetylase family protein n=1 Tax=Microbacterium ulmi TaxID=179095 RepID=A0A7Y2M1F5_9MICO|nr:polysaccharide deacetylase family protein [Microbacterium ulmi]NII69988.1 hypothetical protein [Microbacterium ulmi]NNH04582.1 polysaccharide deacetylase family protein [Microbacterium ulmi]
MEQSGTRRGARDARTGRRRTALIASGAVVLALAIATPVLVARLAIAGQPAAAASPTATQAPTPAPTPTPTPTPLTEAQRLLKDSGDPNACAVTFAGEGIAMSVVRQTQGVLYRDLPLPRRDGFVFGGWYPTDADAAAYADATRINGADVVACADQQITLHAAWTTPDAFAAAGVQVPILMYHQFTVRPEGESGWLRGNFAYVGDVEAQMAYLEAQQFYLPTWDELEGFIDGRVALPKRSVVVTDDDADQTWFDLGAPIVASHHILSTSFMITAYRQDPPPNMYVQRRSHTHDMHKAGANGKGQMVNLSPDEIAADLSESARVLGVAQVIAYPFGHYDDRSKQGVAQAGFTMARTIDWGYVKPGTDKLALPVIRINYGTPLDEFIRDVG